MSASATQGGHNYLPSCPLYYIDVCPIYSASLLIFGQEVISRHRRPVIEEVQSSGCPSLTPRHGRRPFVCYCWFQTLKNSLPDDVTCATCLTMLRRNSRFILTIIPGYYLNALVAFVLPQWSFK